MRITKICQKCGTSYTHDEHWNGIIDLIQCINCVNLKENSLELTKLRSSKTSMTTKYEKLGLKTLKDTL